jgi:hypothetical protein
VTYVPGFQHDLFISYASEDYDPQMDGFVAELRVYLSRELGKFFRGDSAFFLALRYRRSTWRRRELGDASFPCDSVLLICSDSAQNYDALFSRIAGNPTARSHR